MLLFGHQTDPFGRKYCIHTYISDKVISTHSKKQTQLLQTDYPQLIQLLVDFRQLFDEVLWGVKPFDGLSVDVTSAPLIVGQSNYIIEDGSYLLNLRLTFFQKFYGPLHDLLRFLATVEKRVELINDIGFTILLRALYFFLHVPPPFFCTPLHNCLRLTRVDTLLLQSDEGWVLI